MNAGIVHRDTKIANFVFIWFKATETYKVKLVDYGLSRYLSEEREEADDFLSKESIYMLKQVNLFAASIFKAGTYGTYSISKKRQARLRKTILDVTRSYPEWGLGEEYIKYVGPVNE